jgi:AbrB family looped-hinge helix DNA binding protein
MHKVMRTTEKKRKGVVMPIGKIGQRRQVVIPKEIFDALGLQTGDFVEVTQVKRTVVIKPKKIVDADELLTPEQKAKIDARLAEGLEDIKQGRVYGPFDSVEAMVQSLHRAKPPKQRKQANTATT